MSPRLLPLFPLPLVLFPGAVLPLHVFEPRYRRLLADCLAADREFGLLFLPDGATAADLAPGSVGCVAFVEQVEPLPDGRSNLIVSGRRRFQLRHLAESPQPYTVGEVRDFDDERDSLAELDALAGQLRSTFERVAAAARTISDEPQFTPTLPEHPAELTFAVAALLDLDLAARQQLLASRSARERLEELIAVLDTAVLPLEDRARVHRRAGSNGTGPHKPG